MSVLCVCVCDFIKKNSSVLVWMRVRDTENDFDDKNAWNRINLKWNLNVLKVQAWVLSCVYFIYCLVCLLFVDVDVVCCDKYHINDGIRYLAFALGKSEWMSEMFCSLCPITKTFCRYYCYYATFISRILSGGCRMQHVRGLMVHFICFLFAFVCMFVVVVVVFFGLRLNGIYCTYLLSNLI